MTLRFPHLSRYFLTAWVGCFISLLLFDLIWSVETSYRALSFLQTYVYAAIVGIIMAFPAFIGARRWVQAIALIAIDLLMIANLMYCRTYFVAIPPSSYLLAGNVAEFSDSILHSLRWQDSLFFIVTAIILILMGKRPQGEPQWKAYWLYLGCGVILAALLSFKYGDPISHAKHLKRECYYRATPPVVYTLPVSILADLTDGIQPVSEQEKTASLEWLRHHADFQGSQPQFNRKPGNLVMIIVESLEGWPIGKTIEGKEITPNLNSYIADSTSTWVATRVQSQVGSGRSIEGQLLMTVGVHPDRDYVYSMAFPEHHYPHIVRQLQQDRPIKSHFLSGDRATAWNQGAVMLSFGINDTRFRDNWDSSEYFSHTKNPSDKSLFHQIINKMQSGEIWPDTPSEKSDSAAGGTFVEIVTFSGHYPFTIPPEKRTISLSGDYPELFKGYVEAVNYTDGAIGEFLTYLKSRHDWDDTMVIIVGDHEGLASNRKEIRKASPTLAALVDEGKFVPMIAINAPVGGHFEKVMGQVDVYPTILDLMGITSEFTGMGISALRPDAPGFAIDLYGNVAGDTIGVSPRLIEHIRRAPDAASVLIRADLLP